MSLQRISSQSIVVNLRWLLLVVVAIAVGYSSAFAGPLQRPPVFKQMLTTITTTTTTTSTAKATGGVHSRTTATPASTRRFSSPVPTETKCPVSKSMGVFGSLWGSMGVVYILAKAVKRVLPIALEPFQSSKMVLTPLQWSLYAFTCLFFAYYEGYKGFQKKFSPLIVKRACSLIVGTPQGSVGNFLLAPLYSMGLWTATKKRMITSWSVTIGVSILVALVKRLQQPYRSIVDGGVVVGLTWGMISILVLYINSWRTGSPPAVDACLPDFEQRKKKKA